ncbi:unnamed protein product [Closterium sp. NIES-64]|nr:unnamed protein product [Closterium sp. NIES-64]
MARLRGITVLSLLLAVALVLSTYALKASANPAVQPENPQVAATGKQPKRTSDGKYLCADVMKGNGSAHPSLSISHRSHEHIQISPEQHRRGELTLQHLSHCHVSVRGVLSAVFLRHVRDCHVILCPVSGACHVEDASGSTVAVASHQLRIHQTERADFYVRTRSRPLIEHSKGVRFAPYSREYDGLEADFKDADLAVDGGLWALVDDFSWLRAVSSPNWSVIPEEERKS